MFEYRKRASDDLLRHTVSDPEMSRAAEAIARDGLPLAGWVANIIDPKTSRLEENLATLAERLPAPCLGRVPKLKHARAGAVAEYLELDLLD